MSTNLQSLDDCAFAELHERVDAEYNRREDAKLADEIAAIPIEVRVVNLRRERVHAGQSLKVRQYDYARGIKVVVCGHTIGSYFLQSKAHRFGDAHAEEAFIGSIHHHGYYELHKLSDCHMAFPSLSDRVIRLLAARIHTEIKALIAEVAADGKPMMWTGYADGSPVPAGSEKGKVRR